MNSSTALLKSALRLIFRRRAKESADLNNLSGMDMAVFMVQWYNPGHTDVNVFLHLIER